jgi:hypothetical protein
LNRLGLSAQPIYDYLYKAIHAYTYIIPDPEGDGKHEYSSHIDRKDPLFFFVVFLFLFSLGLGGWVIEYQEVMLQGVGLDLSRMDHMT